MQLKRAAHTPVCNVMSSLWKTLLTGAADGRHAAKHDQAGRGGQGTGTASSTSQSGPGPGLASAGTKLRGSKPRPDPDTKVHTWACHLHGHLRRIPGSAAPPDARDEGDGTPHVPLTQVF